MAAECDAVALASQLGRLDLVSLLLAVLGLLLALGGIVAFLNLRGIARTVAREEAKTQISATVEEQAIAYMQAELPSLVEAYIELARNAATDEKADAIAKAQDDGDQP